MDKRAFSQDGFILDQRYTAQLPYGKYFSDRNGCGWIAAYNLLHALQIPCLSEQIRKELEAHLPWGGCLGTPVRTVRRCLQGWGLPVQRFTGRRRVLRAMQSCKGGILRYPVGLQAHYVAFLRREDGCLHVWNSIAGASQDLLTPEQLLYRRNHFPFVRALLIMS